MDKKELLKLTKRQLLEVIFYQQQDEIQLLKKKVNQFEQYIHKLERLLKLHENPHTPSSKKRKSNTKKDEDKTRFPGKPPGSGGGGVQLPPPDEVEEHSLDACPSCKSYLGHSTGYNKRTVLDFPEKPIIVTEHRFLQYHCNTCNEKITASDIQHSGVYGPHLRSVVVMLKNLTNSSAKIADFLREIGAPSFSCAQVQRITDEFANKLDSRRQKMLKKLRKAPYIHADETGLRKDGKNGYVWGLFTSKIALLSAEMSRGRAVIKQLLRNFKGVLVTDGYAGYNEYLLRQRCWSHLLREFKEYAQNDEEITVQYARINQLYELMKKLNTGPPDEAQIANAKKFLNDIVVCLRVIKSGRKLANYIENAGNDWFTALYHEGVPLDNNHAERGLRHVVLHRKMMGCYRNEKGKRFFDIVVSVLQSWKLQKKNVFRELCAVATLT